MVRGRNGHDGVKGRRNGATDVPNPAFNPCRPRCNAGAQPREGAVRAAPSASSLGGNTAPAATHASHTLCLPSVSGARSMLSRFREAQNRELGIITDKARRPRLASDCNSLAEAEKWRHQVIRDISRKVSQIQNRTADSSRAGPRTAAAGSSWSSRRTPPYGRRGARLYVQRRWATTKSATSTMRSTSSCARRARGSTAFASWAGPTTSYGHPRALAIAAA